MLAYPTASVAMPRLRPHPIRENAKTCVPQRQKGHGHRRSRYDRAKAHAQKQKCSFRFNEMIVLPPVQNA
eukprot:10563178-Lingulodinium_polyedra.AAC.1